jgi:hypothetical protein
MRGAYQNFQKFVQTAFLRSKYTKDYPPGGFVQSELSPKPRRALSLPIAIRKAELSAP